MSNDRIGQNNSIATGVSISFECSDEYRDKELYCFLLKNDEATGHPLFAASSREPSNATMSELIIDVRKKSCSRGDVSYLCLYG